VIGAGKSTLADALGRSLDFPVIDSDRTRKALAGVPVTQPAPADAYAAAFTDRTYDELFRRAEVVLDSGRGVILDATFRDRLLRLRARELARRHRRPFRFVGVRREFDPVTELAAGEHVLVRTTAPVSAQVEAVCDTFRGCER
jgi:predicted kinase